jgi:hypothetical protein
MTCPLHPLRVAALGHCAFETKRALVAVRVLVQSAAFPTTERVRTLDANPPPPTRSKVSGRRRLYPRPYFQARCNGRLTLGVWPTLGSRPGFVRPPPRQSVRPPGQLGKSPTVRNRSVPRNECGLSINVTGRAYGRHTRLVRCVSDKLKARAPGYPTPGYARRASSCCCRCCCRCRPCPASCCCCRPCVR